MGKFKNLVPCLCWRSLGTVTEPSKRQAVGAGPRDQLSEKKLLEMSPPQEHLQQLQEPVACVTVQSTAEIEPQEQQTAARLDAAAVPNDATSSVLAKSTEDTPQDGNFDRPTAFDASTDEEKRLLEVDLPLPQCKACVDSSIAVLEEKLNYHEEGRNTSQETTPGTESRVTSSPISFMCLASTTAGEDEHRAIVSTPPNLDSQGNQKEEEFVNVKNIVQDKQREAHCSLIALRTEPRGEDDHRAVVATVPSPGTHESHEEQMGVISAPKATRKDRISSIHHFSHEHTVGEGAEPNAASIQLVKPDDTQESLGDARVRKANSKAMKRKPCPNKNSRTHNEANPGQTAGAAADPCAVGDSTVLDVGSVESGLKSKEQEGEPLAPQNGDKQAESAKSVRKNKRKKTSKAKGKRRHGKTGRR